MTIGLWDGILAQAESMCDGDPLACARGSVLCFVPGSGFLLFCANFSFDFSVAFDEDFVCFLEEEAVVYDAGDGIEEGTEFIDVVVFERDIENEVSVVCHIEMTVECAAADAVEAKVSHCGTDGSQAERHDRDGQRVSCAQLFYEFGLINDVDASI